MFYDYVVLLFFFFFFKQKTAYEIRKGDWSSDVCSSDLRSRWTSSPPSRSTRGGTYSCSIAARRPCRSEERRVGKEGPSLCRSRWSPSHLKKNMDVERRQIGFAQEVSRAEVDQQL